MQTSIMGASDYALVDRDYLDGITIPERTESYQPVPYTSFINIIEEKLDKEGLKILNENYRLSKDGNKLFGIWGVQSETEDLRMSLGFSNSYDKSMSVGMVSGAQVKICTNGMFWGEFKKIRKHTINFYKDVHGIVDYVVDGMQDKHYNLQKDVEKMKELELSPKDERFLFGDILLSGKDIATPNILNQSIKHWQQPPYEEFVPRNLWSFYNAFTESYKGLRPDMGAKPYISLHKYCLSQLN